MGALHKHKLLTTQGDLGMFYFAFLVGQLVGAVAKNTFHLQLFKNRSIVCDGFVYPAILLAGEHKAWNYFLTHIITAQCKMPRNAILVVDPSILFTPGIFTSRHHDNAFFA